MKFLASVLCVQLTILNTALCSNKTCRSVNGTSCVLPFNYLQDDGFDINSCLFIQHIGKFMCPTEAERPYMILNEQEAEECGPECPKRCTLPVDYVTCDNVCSHFEPGHMDWQCNGECQSLSVPCEGECLKLSEPYFGVYDCKQDTCGAATDWYYCDHECVHKSSPCHGVCSFGLHFCNGLCIQNNSPCDGKCPDNHVPCPSDRSTCLDGTTNICYNTELSDQPGTWLDPDCPNTTLYSKDLCEQPEWSEMQYIGFIIDGFTVQCQGVRKSQFAQTSDTCNVEYNCMDRSDESGCRSHQQTLTLTLAFDTTAIDCSVENAIPCNGKCQHDLTICRNSYDCGPDFDLFGFCSNFTYWGHRECPLDAPRRCNGNKPFDCFGGYRVQGGSVEAQTIAKLSTEYFDTYDGTSADEDYYGFNDYFDNEDEDHEGDFFDAVWIDYPRQCADGSDLVFSGSDGFCSQPTMVMCVDNKMCVTEQLVCDGYVHCNDGSDEDPKMCGECPRTFGYPLVNRESASFSCLHKYTGRLICATPCNGINDLCKDDEDEACAFQTFTKFVVYLSFVFLLIVVPTVLFEALYKNEKKQDNPAIEITNLKRNFLATGLAIKLISNSRNQGRQSKRAKKTHFSKAFNAYKVMHGNEDWITFSENMKIIVTALTNLNVEESVAACQYLHSIELKAHQGNEIKVLSCYKGTLGTNSLSRDFLEKVELSLGNKLKILIPKNVRMNLENPPNCVNAMIVYGKLMFKLVSYYLDLVKDVIFLVFITRFASPITEPLSFGSQVLLLSILGLFLSNCANVISILFNTSLHLSNTKKTVMSFLVLFSPALALHHNAKCQLDQTYCWSQIKCNLLRGKKLGKRNFAHIRDKLSEINKLEENRIAWKQLLSEFKRNENVFENFVQVDLLVILSCLAVSQTRTIHELLLSGALDDNVVLFVLSTLWSLRTLIFGFVKYLHLQKDGFVPLKGKIFTMLYFTVCIFARALAVVCVFIPSLGLFNTLGHFEMGIKPMKDGDIIFDVKQLNESNFQVTYLRDIWKPLNNITDLTGLDLGKTFSAFLVAVLCHIIISMAISLLTIPEFLISKGISKKAFHVISLLLAPTLFKDWDETFKEITPIPLAKVVSSNRIEILTKVCVFAISNFICSVPIFILGRNVFARDAYLIEYFPPLPEEVESTNVVMTLCFVLPILFLVIVPALQLGLMWLYYYKGHAWSRILIAETSKDSQTCRDESEEIATIKEDNEEYEGIQKLYQ